MSQDNYNGCKGLKPTLAMILAQTALALVNIFYKLAVSDGMSPRILIAYRFLFATAVMGPMAFIVERNNVNRPKITWKVIYLSFFCGLFGGSLGQNVYIESIVLTSATFATAMVNLVPAFTFILAVSLRMEKLSLRRPEGKAKLLGTLIGIGGAMVLTFYKGKELNMFSTNIDLLHHGQQAAALVHKSTAINPWGALLAVVSCLCFASWLIFQAKLSQVYPSPYSCTALMCVMGSIQGFVIALCVERDRNQWKLGWDIRLLAAAFVGIIGSGLAITLVNWSVRVRGPLFVSVFNPLMLVIVALLGALLLDEKIYIGSVIGAVLIVFALYIMLWGSSREMKRRNQIVPDESDIELPMDHEKAMSTDHGRSGRLSNVSANGSVLVI